MQTRTPTVLITGASAGIGEALARRYAAEGHRLILTARREDRLQTLAGELQEQHGTRSQVIAADLAEPDAVDQLVSGIHWPVDILINNAGYGVAGKFTSVDWSTHQDFMQVMVTAVIKLSYRLLPGMQERGEGQIINVASLAGLVPSAAGHTLYGASKAFLVRFSESLAAENREHGIRVTALCPGFTYSEFHDVTGTRDQVSEMPERLWMSAEEVAAFTLKAMAADHPLPVLIPGRHNRNINRLLRWLPRKWGYRLVNKRSKSFRKTD